MPLVKGNSPHMKFYYEFVHNGWESIFGEENHIDAGSESVYMLTVTCNYDVDVYAVVHTTPDNLCIDGHYGVAWLDAHYEYEGGNRFLSWNDMDDMRNGIICAENNLVKLGIPFIPDYKFHGDNAEWLTEQNAINREKWNLEELERRPNDSKP